MNLPLIVIVGETASGKSDLAMEVAKQFNGEIICADSRTIYKGMDIGTAKPSVADRRVIPHHLLDIVEPGQHYSAADFKKDALTAIATIRDGGHVPVMVGGTGLYIDAVIFDYEFREPAKEDERNKVGSMTLTQLQEKAAELGISEDDINFKNPRHLRRAVEVGEVVKKEKKLIPNTVVVGISRDRGDLEQRIENRINNMVQDGFIEEVKSLGKRYGFDNEAMTGIGYRAFAQYLHGDISLEEAKDQFKKGDLALAKKQRTWFKRNPYIHWFDDQGKALEYISQKLVD